MDDVALDNMIENDFDPVGSNRRCQRCKNRTDKGPTDDLYKISSVHGPPGVYRFRTKLWYRDWAIYKYLRMRVIHQKRKIVATGGPWLDTWTNVEAPSLHFNAIGSYTKRCRGTKTINVFEDYPNNKRKKYTIYNSARKLSAFNVNASLGGEGLDNLRYYYKLAISC